MSFVNNFVTLKMDFKKNTSTLKMDIVKTHVTLKISFSKNCCTHKNTEIYKKFDTKRKKGAAHIIALARFCLLLLKTPILNVSLLH